jgi:spore coat protein CotF
LHVQDYNIKVEYLSNPSGTTMKLQVPQMANTMQSYTQSNTPVSPVTPRLDIQQLNDREIATAYLLTLKRAGREYAWSAMEASNPGVRAFLEDAFTMASHHAFEIWQWMVKKGYYPLEAESTAALNTIGGMYKPAQMPSTLIQ